MNDLPPKQEAFCHEYLKDFNATRAYRDVYKCSQKSAEANGIRLIRNDRVQTKLSELTKQHFEKTDIDAQEILREVKRVALCDVKEAFNEDGSLRSIHDIPEDVRKAISGFEVEEVFTGKGKAKKLSGYIKKMKFWNKDKNNENLMKYLGLFEKDNEQKGEADAKKTIALLDRVRESKDSLPRYEDRFKTIRN